VNITPLLTIIIAMQVRTTPIP